jgi:hypothetical protein
MHDEVPQQLHDEIAARYNATHAWPVEAGRVRDYLLAMDEQADIGPGDAVPPLFMLTFGRTRRPQPQRGTAVKAGDEYTFHLPVFVGDTITLTQRLADIQVKQGRNGPMYLIIADGTFTNQRGEVVCTQRVKTFRWGQ